MARFTATRRNAMLDTNITPANSGIIRVYDGTRPVDADTALSGNNVLAELTLNATSFAAAVAGVLTANAIAQDASANASGTATFARIFQSNGTTVICDVSVSATGGGGELQFSTTAFVATVVVSMSSLTFTFPVGS